MRIRLTNLANDCSAGFCSFVVAAFSPWTVPRISDQSVTFLLSASSSSDFMVDSPSRLEGVLMIRASASLLFGWLITLK